MRRFTKAVLMAVPLLFGAVVAPNSLVPQAQAHWHGGPGGWYGRGPGWGGPGWGRPGWGWHGGYHGHGGAVVGGILGGLALGAVGGAILAERPYVRPPVVYAPPPVVYAPPPPVVYAPPPQVIYPPGGYPGY